MIRSQLHKTKMLETKIRESNFELLRIVTMLFILLHHFLVHGLKTAGYTHLYPHEQSTDSGIFLNSFFVIGVNVFILISGYFGIKQSWKSFLHLYSICLFYGVLLGIALGGSTFFDALTVNYRPFSNRDFWFIQDYFFLWLLSPVLNSVITGLKGNKQKFVFLLCIFAAFQFYFGWFFEGKYNNDGYSFMNFIFLYFIGRFIALHTAKNKSLKLWYLSTYVIICLITGLLMIQHQFGKNWLEDRLYDYNSPFVIVESVAFFLIFRNVKLKSKIINWLATSVLAVYLITESPWIGKMYLYPFVNNLGKTIENDWLLAFYLFALAVVCVIACLLIDKIRIFISTPFENLLCRIPVEKYIKLGLYKVSKLIN